MKKILLPIMMGLLCSPAIAEQSLQDFVRQLGYSEAFIQEEMHGLKDARSDVGAGKARMKSYSVSHNERHQELMEPADLLHPRVFQKGEGAGMIPVLLRLHRQNPASDKITRKLAVTCLRNGQPREALHWYIQTYQRDRSDFESLWNMASIAYRLGEMDQAKKYLKEYAALDPNSAWGRMARDFLAGSFSGADLSDGFKTGFGRTMESQGNQVDDRTRILREQAIMSGESSGSGNGVMVIEGNRTTFDSFMSKTDKSNSPKSKKKNDALEGKTRVKAAVVDQASKSSLQQAKIVEKTVKAEEPIASATATAPPVTP